MCCSLDHYASPWLSLLISFQVVAAHPYGGEDEDELSFEKGEVICVLPFEDPDDQVSYTTPLLSFLLQNQFCIQQSKLIVAAKRANFMGYEECLWIAQKNPHKVWLVALGKEQLASLAVFSLAEVRFFLDLLGNWPLEVLEENVKAT